MISYILLAILLAWCLFNRLREGGKIEGYPLGMPRGTVRAIITLMIVSFPFTYLLNGRDIPGLIVNAMFVAVAFYFEARKSGKEKLQRICKEIDETGSYDLEQKGEKKPLYLPKYSVRTTLFVLLCLILVINFYGPNVPIEALNTVVNLIIIMFFFILGLIARSVINKREEKKINEKVQDMKAQGTVSKFDIVNTILAEEPSELKQKGKSLLSISMLCAVTAALLCFTFNFDYQFLVLPFYEFSLRDTLLLLMSVYYGLRE